MNYKTILKELRNLSLETCTDIEIIDLISKYGPAGSILATYWPPTNGQQFPNLIVRATPYNSKEETINSVDRIKYPPLAKNTRYQRASTPARPMFYGTLNKGPDFHNTRPGIKICFKETFANYDELLLNNDRIVISLWNVELPLRLYTVFNAADYMSQDPEMEEIHQSYLEFLKSVNGNTELIEKTQSLLDYILERFSINVNRNEYEYKPSGVLSQYVLDVLKSKDIKVDGIVFPSTKSSDNDFNIAITPESCDQKLKCLKAMDFELLPDQSAKAQEIFSINEITNLFEHESSSDFILDSRN